MVKMNEGTLGASLKQHRVNKGLSVRAAAKLARIAPMYLSLLERDACGPPSDEKLQRLADVLGEQHVETLFAKAGRVTPQVVCTILRHSTPWSEFIAAAKDLDADHLAGLKALAESGQLIHFAAHGKAEAIAERPVIEKSQRKHRLKGKAEVPRGTKERVAAPQATIVSSARRGKEVSSARILARRAGRP
jgi:transcriptional regulator with XRE-family HTH domain